MKNKNNLPEGIQDLSYLQPYEQKVNYHKSNKKIRYKPDRSITRARSGDYTMSETTKKNLKELIKVAGAILAIGAVSAAVGYIESDDFQPNKKEPGYSATNTKQDAAKEFRNSMRVGENANYSWDSNTVQVQAEREVVDEGR